MSSDQTARHRGYRALMSGTEGDPLAMLTLARLMHGDGLNAEAAALTARALLVAPGDAEVRSLARDLLSADVPKWHFWMVRDELRNAAYDAALRRAVTPSTRVLEIGTGTGILAMMAARAGAKHVYTCEMVPQIAHAAREIIERNGFADRITVIGKHSSEVSAAELGGLADVLVSEIVSNNLLGEQVLPIMSDAIGRLVVPGAAIIPATGRVRVALAHHARSHERRIDTISGFDLSPFNRLSRPFHRVAVDDRDLGIRSDAADLFRFDFSAGGAWPPASAKVVMEAMSDDVNGIAQWIALEMDDSGCYENSPGSMPKSAWAVLFHPLEPMHYRPAPGRWNVQGRHEASTLRLWAEPA